MPKALKKLTFFVAEVPLYGCGETPMKRHVTRSRFLSLAGATALLVAFTAPAAADPVYSWRTEDGGYAFTDDPKAIPARYRDQATLRESARLRDYPRYTPSDDAATERYAEQLTRRLAHLRAMNAQPVARRERRAPSRGTARHVADDG
jgi:hypothetical protein